MVEKLIGTRWASVSSWGRKFDQIVRTLCKEASIARSWFIEAKRAGRDFAEYFLRWKKSRESYVRAWEKSNKQWHIDSVKRALECGDAAVWRLLGDKWKDTSRPIINDKDEVLTNPILIKQELHRFHVTSKVENSSISPGCYELVRWREPFSQNDEVLVIADELVDRGIQSLKNSSVPDNMTPSLIKLLFGAKDLVKPVGDMMRAVARTRIFPDSGKIARQIFCWKGVGPRTKLENFRRITMANVMLKLSESCIMLSAKAHWASAGFPRPVWGHFFGAPESIYIWLCTVEKYTRLGLLPETALTDVSRAFDRPHHDLFKRKLYDFGLPRQLIELTMELISGIKVSLSLGNLKTEFVERGNTGFPQGSSKGM